MTRHRYEPNVPSMGLFVPASKALSHVKPGSAIVGVPAEDGYIRCYYEGGIYHHEAMPFEEKLAIACGRLSERAPTTALAYVNPDDVVHVGTAQWDPVLRTWIISEITDPDAFVAYTGEPAVIGGTREQHERAAGLIINDRSNMDAMIAWQMAVAAKRDPVDALIAHARAQG